MDGVLAVIAVAVIARSAVDLARLFLLRRRAQGALDDPVRLAAERYEVGEIDEREFTYQVVDLYRAGRSRRLK